MTTASEARIRVSGAALDVGASPAAELCDRDLLAAALRGSVTP